MALKGSYSVFFYKKEFIFVDRGCISESEMGSTTLKLATSYALLNRTIQHRWFKNLLSRVYITPGFQCLDIGCGTGINTAHLAHRVGPGGSVTGVDPDSYRIQVAREEQACDNVNYVVAKSTCLPPREGG